MQPIIDYGCVIWGSCGQSLLLSVHKIMKQCARIVLNVEDKRQVSDNRKHHTRAAPAYHTHVFILSNSVHDHHTHGCTNIHARKYNLSVGQRTFAYIGGKLWDTIPVHIRDSKYVECLKTLSRKIYIIVNILNLTCLFECRCFSNCKFMDFTQWF